MKKIYWMQTRVPIREWGSKKIFIATFEEAIARVAKELEREEVFQARISDNRGATWTYIPQWLE